MKDLLKFITCGSVDDGKSTLIGHILYDSKLLYADQEKALQLDSRVGSRGGEIDYSLLLDGLTEEREQGITIDVAYRYFTTDYRSFIVADTPGHEEYTRNMAVGASFADLAVILVDASQGVLVQTRRHARICSFMGIRHFVFAVNKMDLVDYREKVFEEIQGEIRKLSEELGLKDVVVIPVSATEGDNVTRRSDKMPWYTGDVLLHYLENVDVDDTRDEKGFYMPVQRVCRPSHEFRGFQGQIASGSVSVGQEITVLPGGEKAKVRSILVTDKNAGTASVGQPVTVQLDREIDVSRGSVITAGADLTTADSITATILWMDDSTLENGKNFFVKLGTKQIPGMVTKILYSIDVNTGKHRKTQELHKNEIAVCRISFTEGIVVDEFRKHRDLGELILIDRITFQTSACGVVEHLEKGGYLGDGKVDEQTRCAALGQHAVTVVFREDEKGITQSLLEEVERKLITAGRHTLLYHPAPWEPAPAIVSKLKEAGIVTLLLLDSSASSSGFDRDRASFIEYDEDSFDADSIADFVKKVSVYDSGIVRGGDYI